VLAEGWLTRRELRSSAWQRLFRDVYACADGRAGSPQETRLRLILHRSALPRPVPQYTVRVDGRFVARVDLAWPEAKVAVEYEGVWHGERQQVAHDRDASTD
jgi:hypothetical protein